MYVAVDKMLNKTEQEAVSLILVIDGDGRNNFFKC
jgi:hypothetical protein